MQRYFETLKSFILNKAIFLGLQEENQEDRAQEKECLCSLVAPGTQQSFDEYLLGECRNEHINKFSFI